MKDHVAVGYWQAITSTEGHNYTYQLGVNYALSNGTVTEVQNAINNSMESGVEVDGFLVESSYLQGIIRGVQSTYGIMYGT